MRVISAAHHIFLVLLLDTSSDCHVNAWSQLGRGMCHFKMQPVIHTYPFPSKWPAVSRGSKDQPESLNEGDMGHIPPLVGLDMEYEQEIKLSALSHWDFRVFYYYKHNLPTLTKISFTSLAIATCFRLSRIYTICATF